MRGPRVRPGISNIQGGAGLAAVGIITAAAVWFALRGKMDASVTHPAFWGLSAVGGIQLVVGLFQLISFNLRPPTKYTDPKYTDIEMRAILLSMVHPDQSNDSIPWLSPTTIWTILATHTRIEVDDDALNSLVKQAQSNKLNCLEEIKNLSGSMSAQARTMAVKMSFIATDYMTLDYDLGTVMEVARVVGIKRADANQIIRDCDPDHPSLPEWAGP